MATSVKLDITNRALTSRMSRADWVKYINDHRNYLRSTGTLRSISDLLFEKYKYRPLSLIQKLGIDPSLVFTVIILNDISLVEGLQEHHRTLIIPNEEYLENITTHFAVSS